MSRHYTQKQQNSINCRFKVSLHIPSASLLFYTGQNAVVIEEQTTPLSLILMQLALSIRYLVSLRKITGKLLLLYLRDVINSVITSD